MGSCFVTTLLLEFIFKSEEQPIGRYIFAHFLVIMVLIFISSNDCTERYLAYYDYINPFLILMLEGIFEFILSLFYSINKEPFKGIVDEYYQNDGGKFALLIILLIVYFFLSAVINVYKVYCNVIYTPMARSMTEYFLNPIINTIYFNIKVHLI